MSYATMEVRHICESLAGFDAIQDYGKVSECIEKAAPLIFDFDFPFWNEEKREEWERRFLLNFYTREISAETYALWKLWLNQKLNRIMPKYNPLYQAFDDGFDALYTVAMTEETKGKDTVKGNETNNGTDTTEGKTHGHSTGSNNGTDNTTDKGSVKHSDTPQGTITDLESGLYMSDANVTDQTTNTTSQSNNELTSDTTNNQTVSKANTKTTGGTTDRTETHTRKGYEGRTAAELMAEYMEQMQSVDALVYAECSDLFLQYYGGVY